jgi:hypothetical protein
MQQSFARDRPKAQLQSPPPLVDAAQGHLYLRVGRVAVVHFFPRFTMVPRLDQQVSVRESDGGRSKVLVAVNDLGQNAFDFDQVVLSQQDSAIDGHRLAERCTVVSHRARLVGQDPQTSGDDKHENDVKRQAKGKT